LIHLILLNAEDLQGFLWPWTPLGGSLISSIFSKNNHTRPKDRQVKGIDSIKYPFERQLYHMVNESLATLSQLLKSYDLGSLILILFCIKPRCLLKAEKNYQKG
jgi:hypothetical protein